MCGPFRFIMTLGACVCLGSMAWGNTYQVWVTQSPPGPDNGNPATWAGVIRYEIDRRGGPPVRLADLDKSLLADPAGLAMRPQSRELFVGNRHGNTGPGSISRFIYDAATDTFQPHGSITGNSLSGVHQLAFSPTTGELFAANYHGGISRFTFDAAGEAVPNGMIGGAGTMRGVAVSPDGKRLYLTGGPSPGGAYTVTTIRQFDLTTGNELPGTSVSGSAGLHYLQVRGGDELYVADPFNSYVFRFKLDPSSDDLTDQVSIYAPSAVSQTFSPDNQEMFATGHLTSHQLTRYLSGAAGQAWVPVDPILPDVQMGDLLTILVAVTGDFNRDEFVDMRDLEVFETCATGPAIPYGPHHLPTGCTLKPDAEDKIAPDLDRDGDVDQDDFGAFQCHYQPRQPGVLSVAEGDGLVSTGNRGGPFAPISKTYTLTNPGGLPINWTAENTQTWTTLSKTSGTLAAKASDTLEISINTGANSLAAGSYDDTVTFTNTTNHYGDTTRGVALTVNQPVPPGMVLIPAGEFQMGNAFDPSEGWSDELPRHVVYLDAFYMDQTEVTNQQYADGLNWALGQGNLIHPTADGVYDGGYHYIICDTTTSSSYSRITWNGTIFGAVSGKANHPVVQVSWYGAAAYANWRSAMQGRPLCYDTSTWECNWGGGYRLPTEAEWEKAARGGAAGRRFAWSNSDMITHARANYYSSSSYWYDESPTRGYHPTFKAGAQPYTSPVGHFAANGYGLYDMTGNVWEWCNDCHGAAYGPGPENNPRGPVCPASGSWRIYRGGSWSNNPVYCRAAFRFNLFAYFPGRRYDDGGFRLALHSE